MKEEVISETERQASKTSSRDYRLDLVKAISISLVLLLHLRPLRIVISDISTEYANNVNFYLDQIYLNSTLLAVPLFILTSLFLFFQKLQELGFNYLKKRCSRLLQIFAFWTGFHILFYYVISFFTSLQSSQPFSLYIPKLRIYKLIAGVDPALPIVGDSVFYFIFALLLLIVIGYFLFYEKGEKYKTYVGISIIGLSAAYFEYLSLVGENLEYWRVDGFIIYVPIAYFLVKYGEDKARKYNFLLYTGFVVFGLQDIFLRSIQKDIGLYGRISVVCGATALFISCLNLKPQNITSSVAFLSKFSLGIFAIHKYWLFLATIITLWLFQVLDVPSSVWVMGLEMNITAVVSAALTLLLTIISVPMLANSSLKCFFR